MAWELKRKIFGIADGNFNPMFGVQPRSTFLAAVHKAAARERLPSTIFAPTVTFTNRVVMLGEDDESWSSYLIRTKSDADGGVVAGAVAALALFNADCLNVTLFDRHTGSLANLHGGYRTLIRGQHDEPSIIEVALRGYFEPARVRAYIWGGIGPCCWRPEYPGEKDNKPEILQPKTSPNHPALLEDSMSTTSGRSPFGKGCWTVDLYQLARLILRRVGVRDEQISWDTTCTCCAMTNGKPNYWSHTRYKKAVAEGRKDAVDGRNMSVVWLEPASDTSASVVA